MTDPSHERTTPEPRLRRDADAWKIFRMTLAAITVMAIVGSRYIDAYLHIRYHETAQPGIDWHSLAWLLVCFLVFLGCTWQETKGLAAKIVAGISAYRKSGP